MQQTQVEKKAPRKTAPDAIALLGADHKEVKNTPRWKRKFSTPRCARASTTKT